MGIIDSNDAQAYEFSIYGPSRDEVIRGERLKINIRLTCDANLRQCFQV